MINEEQIEKEELIYNAGKIAEFLSFFDFNFKHWNDETELGRIFEVKDRDGNCFYFQLNASGYLGLEFVKKKPVRLTKLSSPEVKNEI